MTVQGSSTNSVVLVTGGTGAVGRYIASVLLDAGYHARVFSRYAHRNALAGAESVAGDIQDAAAVARAAVGVDAVVHVVGILRERPGQSFEGVHVQGARNVMAAAQENGVQRVIYIGGTGADPDSQDPLSASKGRAEEQVRAGSFDYVILRSSLLFGIDGGVLRRIGWTLHATGSLVLLPCSGRGLFQPLWVGDLAQCILRFLGDGSGRGGSYDLGGPDSFTYRDLAQLLAQHEELHRIFVPVPAPLLQVLGAAPRLIGREPFVTGTELWQLCRDNRVSPAMLLDVFGVAPMHLEAWLAASSGGQQKS